MVSATTATQSAASPSRPPRCIYASTTFFNTETYWDYITIGGQQYSGTAGFASIPMAAQETFTWYTDGSVVNGGFEICGSYISPPSSSPVTKFHAIGRLTILFSDEIDGYDVALSVLEDGSELQLHGVNRFLINDTDYDLIPAIERCYIPPPTPPPFTPPPPAHSHDPCHPGRSLVELEPRAGPIGAHRAHIHRPQVRIDTLVEGQRIRTPNGYEPVIGRLHAEKEGRQPYFVIYADGMKVPMAIADQHWMYLNGIEADPATAKVGDTVSTPDGPRKIRSIKYRRELGAYHIVVPSSMYYVDGMLASTYFAGFNMTKQIWGYVELSTKIRYNIGIPILPQGECPVSYTWLPVAIRALGAFLPAIVTSSAPWSIVHGVSAGLCGFYTELLCATAVTATRKPYAAVSTIAVLLVTILVWRRARSGPPTPQKAIALVGAQRAASRRGRARRGVRSRRYQRLRRVSKQRRVLLPHRARPGGSGLWSAPSCLERVARVRCGGMAVTVRGQTQRCGPRSRSTTLAATMSAASTSAAGTSAAGTSAAAFRHQRCAWANSMLMR